MWIHLLALGLIDGGNVADVVAVVDALRGLKKAESKDAKKDDAAVQSI